jgi:hypothetical protein
LFDGIWFLFCACVNCLDADRTIGMERDPASLLRKLTGAGNVYLCETKRLAHVSSTR